MMVLVLYATAFGLTVLGLYLGLAVLFGPAKPDPIDQRIQRRTELESTYNMLAHTLGREPTTSEVWEAAPEHIAS